MSPGARNGAIAAALLLLGGGAATAYIVMAPKPAPAQAVAQASAAKELAVPAGAEAVPVAAPQDPPVLGFDTLVQRFTLVRDSAAYVGASMDAPQIYPLRAGTGLISAAKSRDGVWIVATTQDGQAAYLPAADLGPFDASRAPVPELPAHVAGSATVIDTATLSIDGQKTPLAGVIGESGDYATQLQQLLDAQGPQVQCDLQGQAYLCKLGSGMDIGRAGLYNGAADLAPGASADYQQQADAAKAAHRGIWR